MKKPKELSREELLEIVEDVQAYMFRDISDDGEFLNPDKEWSPDTLDLISETLNQYGLRPSQPTPAD